MTAAPLVTGAAPVHGARRVPLSEQQRGLWIIQKTEPSCGAYHLAFTAEVAGDAELAEHARTVLADLVAETEALRVCVTEESDGPALWIVPEIEPDIRVVDARALDDAQLRSLVRDAARVPFDLARAPLWRVQVFAREGSAVVAVVAHHLALDFWSLGLLLGEVQARLTPGAPRRALDGSMFAEFAAAQAAELSDREASLPLRDRWAQRLAPAPACIELPSDRSRPPAQSYDGGSVPVAFDAATSTRIRELAMGAGATPFMTVLAAYELFLSRISGQSAVNVATPSSGRTDRRFRDALGSFVNTLVLTGEVDEAQTFRELLAATRDRVVDGLRDQRAPLPWLVSELSPPRDPSHAPLAQAGLAWDRLPFLADLAPFFLLEPGPAELALGEARLRPFPVPQQEGQLDLWVELGGERDGGYVGVLRYSTDLFDAGTARDLADAFVATVTSAVHDPDAPMSALAIADTAQRGRLEAWGRGPEVPLPEADVLALVLEQARTRPDAVAVSDDDGELTYRGLADAVDRVAADLLARGVAPGDRVGVMVERDRSLVVALLAVHRAGAAYVPLDPDFPADRLDYMAADARLAVLLTQERHRASWPADAADGTLRVSLLDELGGAEGLAGRLPAHEPRPGGALAYILYTSGSTGRPKGVAVPHGALVNLLLSMANRTGFGPEDVFLAVTTISFDIAGLELFLPLVCGGRVVVSPSAVTRDPHELAHRIGTVRPTWMQATPTTWLMLREAGWPGDPGLRALCGGEPLPEELASFLTGAVAGLTNVYGPTETTIWSTAGPVVRGRGVDLGTPLDNTQLYVTDPAGRLVPPGTFGELWIGGDGVAAGYWGREELTAERFRTGLPCAPHERLYRTGDRVRWTSDGRLEHHGRLDSQVKVRGYRIELAEVESVLAAVPGVGAVVVDARGERLVAYVVPTPGCAEGEPTTPALFAAAAQALPPYMVPSAVVRLNELPLTANKKVDRRALPEPAAEAGESFLEPRDAVEITLARMWTELLGVERLGIRDDFFELGGHSLLAVRLAAMIRDEWGEELRVNDLLRNSTIESLALHLRSHGSAPAQGPLVTLRRGEDAERPLFLFHPFGGTVFCYVELARHLPERLPVRAIEAPGIETPGASEMTVERMAAHYVDLVRREQPEGPYALGGWCFGGVVAFEAARQLRRLGETVELLVAIDSRAPIPANMPADADDLTLLSWFARDLAIPYGRTLDIPPEEFRGQDPDAAFDHVLARAAAIGVLPADADREQMRRYFEVYLASGVALQLYTPPPADVDLMLLTAADERADYGPCLGWDGLVAGTLHVTPVAGDHNSVMYAPNAAAVAAEIGTALAERRAALPAL
ncbi:amino acid adenylation domain-containing protein [Sinomonas sp. JGH33]|uniref:Amino acid adenylation domain-containing protein n=1 Tax=Sinomonas terricola TaxID=3110330 RepID=A0ABU5T692_9MICC|nr:amino acid adenylation domain-containing protein [Sinomonas sp. JGH33]MEA5455188.1 amino acid adenylation domain-containing protein [Sinomonas sp. JGH33]